MKIQWNKVTWYSKWLALALFVALPFIGFYFGEKYGELNGFFKGYSAQAPQSAASGTNSDYYQNTTTWQTNGNHTGWSIAYPIDFDVNDNYSVTPVDDWRQGNPGGPGLKPFTLAIPKAFEPQTNFNEATLSVGTSDNNKAIMQCLVPETTDNQSTTFTKMINGTLFTVFHLTDVGAGNIYEMTSYRTLHAGQCWAVEYTIHSSEIGNYPQEYQLKPLDGAKLHDVLDRIVGTFQFE